VESVFNNLDYSFVAGHEDGSLEQNTSPGLGTRALRKQFKFLKDFMSGLDFINMKPSNHLIQHAPGFLYQGLAMEGESYAYYFEGNGEIIVQLEVKQGQISGGMVDSCLGSKSSIRINEEPGWRLKYFRTKSRRGYSFENIEGIDNLLSDIRSACHLKARKSK
jgi:hypothetical protein